MELFCFAPGGAVDSRSFAEANQQSGGISTGIFHGFVSVAELMDELSHPNLLLLRTGL